MIVHCKYDYIPVAVICKKHPRFEEFGHAQILCLSSWPLIVISICLSKRYFKSLKLFKTSRSHLSSQSNPT